MEAGSRKRYLAPLVEELQNLRYGVTPKELRAHLVDMVRGASATAAGIRGVHREEVQRRFDWLRSQYKIWGVDDVDLVSEMERVSNEVHEIVGVLQEFADDYGRVLPKAEDFELDAIRTGMRDWLLSVT